MVSRRKVEDDYFSWLSDLIDDNDKCSDYGYLLSDLYMTKFEWTIDMDANRAQDGIDLRRRFVTKYGPNAGYILENYLDGECTVLEMMVALADRCENAIMEDIDCGNRTSMWFWEMVDSLGLSEMYDANYDGDFVENVIRIFLDRKYKRDGSGGLFKIEKCREDLRKVEIWSQMCWYLDRNFSDEI